jgi:hypothetical protein
MLCACGKLLGRVPEREFDLGIGEALLSPFSLSWEHWLVFVRMTFTQAVFNSH